MSAATERERAMLDKFNTAALERVAPYTFRFPPNGPDWLTYACGEGVTTAGTVKFEDALSFVANFLVDAESAWEEPASERVSSGVYAIRKPDVPRLFVEFHADRLGKVPILFVELLGLGTPGPRYDAVRTARRSKLELEHARATLHETRIEQRQDDVFMGTLPVLYLHVDRTGQVRDVHANGEYAADGRSRADVGKHLSELFGADRGRDFERHVRFSCDQRQSHAFDFQDYAHGRIRYHHVEINPLTDGQVVVVIRDVTDQVHLEKHLKSLAFRDPLTGLPNRNLLEDRIAQAMRRADRADGTMGVLYIDLDGFKAINDVHGHPAGDAVLVSTADRLARAVRNSDTVIRLGGDEFIVVLEGAARVSDYPQIATKIVSMLSEPFLVGGKRLQVSASVGVSCYPQDGLDVEGLVKRADEAMYRAKEAGKNRVAFATSERPRDVGALHTEFVRALDEHQFEAWFQPIVDVHRRQVVAVESLARWRHPGGEVRRPESFLPTLKSLNLSLDFDRYMFRQSCAAVIRLEASGVQVPVAINVSEEWVRTEGFVEDLIALCREVNIPADRIQLDVSERITGRSDSDLASVFVDLRAQGFRIGIDDFGTGHSSLASLRRYSLDAIKIDSSFVQYVARSQEDRQLCAITMDLARTLAIDVVAEGVETIDQQTALMELGCHRMQGFLISKPIPADVLKDTIAELAERL